ncbi:hypothetical protein PK28_08455 [Hymenobacter sp. DG25B]|uniref:DUF7033 domain-containing protein n=1 Tax=Hymenobacter sp. DG25B TaxID=1385664 RepID=UPI0005413723|nr:hypothetical protein [Hymenobacter sp. DG25B]AIZ63718.1 hypothetical protein PK28_08455 [Hymenobacter sp. DG25B]
MVTISIGYEETDAIQLTRVDSNFFEGQNPYPAPPCQREWRNQLLPFFFDKQPEQPLLMLKEGKALIGVDLVSAAFYLLSGWQEYFSEERDQHGRYPYIASVQYRYGFVTVPVVNYYFDILKTAVEHVTGQPLRPLRWAGGAAWAAFITHDIDNLYSAWKAPAKAALRQGKLLRFGRQLWQHFTHKDAWNNLAQVQQTVAEYGAKSTFFFLPKNRPDANGTPNSDYALALILPQIKALADAGAEIQLHGSIGTATDTDQLMREAAMRMLPYRNEQSSMPGIRFHYLSWEPRATPALLDDLAFEYDTTLGFPEHFGFRNSYCLPFYLFDFQRGRAHDFLEIPLNVMDATLYHPNYLRLRPDEILPALVPMFKEIERFGGVCTVLWHNENFDPANEHNGPQQFRAIMEYLRAHSVYFVNSLDICVSVS